MITRFMEVDGQIGEILGDQAVISYVQRSLGSKPGEGNALNTETELQGGNEFESDIIVEHSKRKQMDLVADLGGNGPVIQSDDMTKNGPKNLITGPASPNEYYCVELSWAG